MGRPFDEIRLTGNIKTFDDAIDEAAAFLLEILILHIVRYHHQYKI